MKESYEKIQNFLDEYCDGKCSDDCRHWNVNGCQSTNNPNNKNEETCPGPVILNIY